MPIFLAVTAAQAGPPLEKAHPGRPVSSHLSLPAVAFLEGDAVRLGWFDTPGNAQDWVTVVAAGQPDEKFGPWTYTSAKTEGVFPVANLPPGDYEARLYLDWPAGGFKVVDRLQFTVVPVEPPARRLALVTGLLAVGRTVFPAGREVKVDWHDTPGAPTDWITVVPKGTADDRWGSWMFAGRKSGTFNAGALAPGDYEARFYFNWPGGGFEVRDRLPFAVRQAAEAPPGRPGEVKR